MPPTQPIERGTLRIIEQKSSWEVNIRKITKVMPLERLTNIWVNAHSVGTKSEALKLADGYLARGIDVNIEQVIED
jgi:hypothetical protein